MANEWQLQERICDLCNLSISILRDECPANPADYLCAEAEEYDDEICLRCWQRQIFKAANGGN